MSALYIWAAIFAGLSVFACFSMLRGEGQKLKDNDFDFVALAVTALIVRVVFGLNSPGYEVDIGCFRAWADMMAASGPGGFYVDGVFCDYPPGYLYVLWLAGIVKPLFHGRIELLIIKLPAILSDIILGYFIYRAAQKAIKNKSISAMLSGLYMLCPAVIVNSAVWGQVDGVFVLPLIFSLYFLADEKYKKSAVFFTLALLVKPQALLFAPIYAFAFADRLRGGDKGAWAELLKSAGLVLLVFVAGVVPFVYKKPPSFIFDLYGGTLASYPYASLNAFNLFALAGGNFKPIDDRFVFSTYSAWSTAGIVISVVVCGLVFLRGKGKSRYFYCSGLVIHMVFMLAGKMHERYLFPALALYLLAYVFQRDNRVLAVGGIVSILHYLNVGYVYVNSRAGVVHIPADAPFLVAVSILGVLSVLLAVYIGFSMYGGIKIREAKGFSPDLKIRRKDVIIMAAVTLLYSVLAFYNLGDMKAPKTKFDFHNATGAIADLGEVKDVSGLIYYKGLGTGKIQIIASKDGASWEEAAQFDEGPCFSWKREEMNVSARFLGVRPSSRDMEIFELAFFEGGDRTPVKLAYGDKELFDEQDLVPEQITYLNGTYFDEIYHARTAYEHINGIWPYEITHPPLGKLIIALGIKLFGMNPFGWRVAGTLFGIAMLPIMYIFAKKMFKSTFAAAAVMLLMTFDFMHFTQTRIATIDTYGVFFIILMYYFMYRYYDQKEASYKKSLMYLFLCGLSFGLGIASKWIGAYAGLGLAILFVLALINRKAQKGEIIKTCLWCVLFFVIIPAAIYFASYIPYFKAEPQKSAFTVFWENQKYMFAYHADLKEGHPFSSKFYQWPIMSRPIWYYGANDGMPAGKVSSIVALGNPAVWWGGIHAVLAAFVIGIKKKDKKAAFILIALFSQYVPWFFIGRTVFIYHFFASVPFVILAFGYIFTELIQSMYYAKRYIISYLAVAFLLFIMFYPIISGMVVDKSFIANNLKWFDSWILSY